MSDPSTSCPRCQGAMRPTLVGELRDKHLQCDYCGHLLDVGDSSTVTHEESERFTDERGRLVQRTRRTTRTRHDGPETRQALGLPVVEGPAGGPPGGLARPVLFERPDGSSVWIDLEDPRALGEQLQRELGAPLAEGALADLMGQLQDTRAGFSRVGDVHELVHESVVEVPWGREDPVRAVIQPPRRSTWPGPRWARPPAPVGAGGPPATWTLLAAVGFGVLVTLLLVAVLT